MNYTFRKTIKVIKSFEHLSPFIEILHIIEDGTEYYVVGK